jgi:stearoyl-CoA desaturase (delta-9 desaturase)
VNATKASDAVDGARQIPASDLALSSGPAAVDAAEDVSGGWRATTLNGAKFRSAQQAHVAFMTIVPLLATVAAVVLAAREGLGRLELALLFATYSLTMIGITAGYHRLLSHRAFDGPSWVRVLFAVLGSTAGQGPPLYWVANHRRHHQYSDKPGDPHSPKCDGNKPLTGLRGLWHAHIGWSIDHELSDVLHYCKDIFRDRQIRLVNRLYYVIMLTGLAVPTAIGAVVTHNLHGALLGLLWGGFVRLFLTFHATNCINSITHTFGGRAFDTREDSRNTLWLVIPTFGEAWHNNHHAFPRSAFFGHGLAQIDLGAWVIAVLERVGLVRDVKRPTLGRRPGREGDRP